MIRFISDPVVTDGLAQWRGRTVFETDLSSAQLRGFSRELRQRCVFSARTTNARYLQEVSAVVDQIQAGEINMATGRLRLMRLLKELGYDPAVGFPGDMATIPPAERDSLQDLSSLRRINLMLETNVSMSANYGRMVAGNTEYGRREYPAWELVRIFVRTLHRGDPKSHTAGWASRWADAGESVGWAGAVRSPLIALKDSPIWAALADGAGGYSDTLDNPFPPFAFGSGMGWRAVPRAECLRVGLLALDPSAVPAETAVSFAPSESSITKAFDGMSAELQDELRRELAELA